MDTLEKKSEKAEEKAGAVAGAKLSEEMKKSGEHHDLMSIKLNLLEISHRTIEKIEKKRYEIMRRKSGVEAVEEFRDFIFSELIVKND